MSFANWTTVEKFTFQVSIKQDGDTVKKMIVFPSLLNGIRYVYMIKILGWLIVDDISIYDKNTKKKLARGDIDSIYTTYLNTYPRPKYMIVDDFMIDILQLLGNLHLDPYDAMKNSPTVQQIIKINTDYARKILKDI